jgi:protein transport protein SEC31
LCESIVEVNARQQLLDQLGFHPDAIAQAAFEYSEQASINGIDKLALDDRNVDKTPERMSRLTEATIKRALLVGNFEAAVECCFRTGNLADALILASCGGAELWAKAQERYFASEAPKRPFLSIVSAVIHNQV